jgi:hypothetical protein
MKVRLIIHDGDVLLSPVDYDFHIRRVIREVQI